MELLNQTLLQISNTYCYALIIIIGFIFYKRSIFAHALVLLLFTNVYNFWLKSLFKMPLPPALGSSNYGFPSGHTHSSVVFWGWLAISFKQWWMRALCLAIAVGHGFAIVEAGYHYPKDVVAAFAFAGVTLAIYRLALKQKVFEKTPALLGIILAGLSFVLLYLIPTAEQKRFIWEAHGALTGFSLGWLNINQHNIAQVTSLKLKVGQLMFVVVALIVVQALFMSLQITNFGLVFVQFFLTGLALGISPRLVAANLLSRQA